MSALNQMARVVVISLLSACLPLLALGQIPSVQDIRAARHGATRVPLVALLATPERFAGQFVEVTGVVSVRSGEFRVFLDSDSYNHAVFVNSIRMTSSEDGQPFASVVDGHYARVFGTFRLLPSGRVDVGGELINVLLILPTDVFDAR